MNLPQCTNMFFVDWSLIALFVKQQNTFTEWYKIFGKAVIFLENYSNNKQTYLIRKFK